MLNIRYYRKDEQLGKDLLELGMLFFSTDLPGDNQSRKSYTDIIRISENIKKKLIWSSKRKVKLELLEVLQNHEIIVHELIYLAFLFAEECITSNVCVVRMNSFSEKIIGLCKNDVEEIYKYLKVQSIESILLKKGVIITVQNGEVKIAPGITSKLMGLELAPKITEVKRKIKTPTEIKKELDNVVIGQEEAKKVISLAAYSYMQCIENGESLGFPNILLLGPTGCGKTHLMNTLAKVIEIPIIITDATLYTKEGYVGSQVIEILYNLEKEMKLKGESRAGIVYIDEIDKICEKEIDGRDIGGRSVQEELLKLLDKRPVNGRVYFGGYRGTKTVSMDTSNILFVCGGVFSGCNNTKEISGFSKSVNKPDSEITFDSLIKYGMLPELLGRLPIKVHMNQLSVNELAAIIKNSEISPIMNFLKLFPSNNKIRLTDETIKKLALKAQTLGFGARGLTTALERYFAPLLYGEDKNIVLDEIMK